MKTIRAPFLILSVALVAIGVTAAYRDGYHDWFIAGLLLAGVVLAHISVNLFNELSDYQTGIDEKTGRTPFSGGSGALQSGQVAAKTVKISAYSTLVSAFVIGIYFMFRAGWPIIVFMLIGFVAIRFYTSHLTRWALGELFAGLALGSCVVLGVYYALTGHLTQSVILLSIPPGILTMLLLLLNEIPDAAADKAGGRCHLVILLGKKNSIYLYMFGLIIVYALILALHIFLALITIPLAVLAGITALKNIDQPKFQLAQALNVAVVIITDLLLTVGH